MAYILKKSDNETLVVLNDGTVDTAVTSLTLVGKNVSGYGNAQNENFVYLLENFANTSLTGGQPNSPVRGQLWFDTNPAVNRLLVFDGASWRPLAVSMIGNSPTNSLINAVSTPAIPYAATQPGDLWFNSASNQLFVITGTGSNSTLIGPEAVSGFGTTKMTSTSMVDNTGQSHPVIQITLDGEIVGILSNVSFLSTTTNAVVGFPTIYRGLTFKNYNSSTRYTTATTDVVFHGLHEQLDQTYTQKTVNEHIQNNWSIDDGNVLYFGSTGQSLVGWNTVSSFLTVASSSKIQLKTTSSWLTFDGASLTPSNISLTLGTPSYSYNSVYSSKISSGNPTSIGLFEGNWQLTNNSQLSPQNDLSVALGSSSTRFTSVYATELNAGAAGNLANITGLWRLTNSSIIAPLNDQSVDLGQSVSKFSTIYVSSLTGLTKINSSPVVAGNILPSADLTYTLGSSLARWSDIYANNVHSAITTSDSHESNSGAFTNFNSTNATITGLTVSDEIVTHLTATVASINSLTLTTGLIANANIINLSSTNASINSLNSNQGTFGTISVSTLTATNLYSNLSSINNLIATTGTISNLQSNVGLINSLSVSNTATVNILKSNFGTINTFTANSAVISGALNASSGGFVNLSANSATIFTLSSPNANFGNSNITNLTASYGTFGTLNYTYGSVDNHSISNGNITTLIAGDANISNLIVTNETVSTLTATSVTANSVAVTSNLTSPAATIGSLASTNLTFTTIADSLNTIISKFDTDGALVSNTDSNISTQKAVKTYVDNTKNYLVGLINSLQTAINNIQTVPTGSVFFVAMTSPPTGYIVCDGSSYSADTYPGLYSAIGHTFGGAGRTFNVPDLRGEFIRGWDNGRGIDLGRVFGSLQNDAMQGHVHGPGSSISSFWGDYVSGTAQGRPTGSGGSYEEHKTGSPITDGTNGTPRTASETRPTNVALLPIIKT